MRCCVVLYGYVWWCVVMCGVILTRPLSPLEDRREPCAERLPCNVRRCQDGLGHRRRSLRDRGENGGEPLPGLFLMLTVLYVISNEIQFK